MHKFAVINQYISAIIAIKIYFICILCHKSIATQEESYQKYWMKTWFARSQEMGSAMRLMTLFILPGLTAIIPANGSEPKASSTKSPAAVDISQFDRLNFGESPGEPGFLQLFNGEDLTGWDGQPGSWTVEDGVIQCTGVARARNWLIWRGFGAADFELRLEFRYRKGNSGVQVRSSDIGNWQVRGYQVEVSPSEGMGLWHHSLMSRDIETQNTRKHLATAGQRVRIDQMGNKVTEQFADAATIQAHYTEAEWNTMTVIARGNRLIQKINGVLFADLTDDQAGFSAETGVIAFQDHGKGADVAFRNIRLKFLDSPE